MRQCDAWKRILKRKHRFQMYPDSFTFMHLFYTVMHRHLGKRKHLHHFESIEHISSQIPHAGQNGANNETQAKHA